MGEEDIAAATLAGLNKSCSDVAPKPAEDTTSASLTKTTVSDEIPKKKRGRKPKQAGPKFPVEPVVIQVVNRPKGYMNHSYRDFSKVPPEIEQEEEEQSNNNMDEETRIAGMTFAQKVHELVSLEGPSQNWIAWQVHGRAFKILVPKLLEQSKLLLKYFGHNRYSSFLRQLNNFGFKHISQGPDRNCYYHEVRVNMTCLLFVGYPVIYLVAHRRLRPLSLTTVYVARSSTLVQVHARRKGCSSSHSRSRE